MKARICPICGMGELIQKEQKKAIEVNGIKKEIDTVIYHCPICNEEGDFFGENDKAIHDALITVQNDVAVSILEGFSSEGKNFASIERALGLPQRTLGKWKSRSSVPSAAGVALLKFINIYPWLLEVADSKFEKKAASNIFFRTALCEFMNIVAQNSEYDIRAGFASTAKTQTLFVQTTARNPRDLSELKLAEKMEATVKVEAW